MAVETLVEIQQGRILEEHITQDFARHVENLDIFAFHKETGGACFDASLLFRLFLLSFDRLV